MTARIKIQEVIDEKRGIKFAGISPANQTGWSWKSAGQNPHMYWSQ